MDGAIASRQPAYGMVPKNGGAPGGLPPVTRFRSRYTRYVSAMKLVLPVVACTLAVLVVAWPQFDDPRRVSKLKATSVNIDNVGGQRVINARYSGTDRRDRPFVVTAEEALQSDADPENIRLKNPQADLAMQGGTWLAVTAPEGRLRKEGKMLALFGGISLFRDDGYEMRTDRATVNLKDGTAQGNQTVWGQGPFGTLRAAGFKILESGQRVVLTGKSKVTFKPIKKAGK